MTSLELLDAIGTIRDKYVLEAHSTQAPQRRRLSLNKTFLIAAIIALMLLLVGCVAVFLGLRELNMGKYSYDAGFGETESSNFISLQGYVGSANYQASREWKEFLAAYDADGELLKNADSGDYVASIDYMSYLCYTPEMEAKINEICEKYGLEVLGPTYFPENAWKMFTNLGIGNIVADGTVAEIDLYDAYYYRDGTFQTGGNTLLTWENNPWPYSVSFAYRCVMKTAFDGVCLTVGEPDSYDQWTYTVKDGTQVLLALSGKQALIIADMETHFVSVNIPLDSAEEGGAVMDREALEAIADTFRFAHTPSRPDADSLVEPEWYTTAGETEPLPTIADTAPTAGQAPEESWQAAREAFQNILSGDGVFFDRDQCRGVTLEEYCRSLGVSAEVCISKYTLVDLERDGVPELIFQVTVNENDYGILALRYGGGVTGYFFVSRQMMALKTDGTFRYSGGAANNGISGIRFSENGWEYAKIGFAEENGDNSVSFYWNGGEVSEEAYWQLAAQQDGKEDVTWRDYPSKSYDLTFA